MFLNCLIYNVCHSYKITSHKGEKRQQCEQNPTETEDSRNRPTRDPGNGVIKHRQKKPSYS